MGEIYNILVAGSNGASVKKDNFYFFSRDILLIGAKFQDIRHIVGSPFSAENIPIRGGNIAR